MSEGNNYSDSSQPQPPKKSSGTKVLLWILGIGGGVLLVSCLGCVGVIYYFSSLISGAISSDPATIRKTAQTITEITLPPGYDPVFSMNMFGIRMAVFGDKRKNSGKMLMLAAFPASMAGSEDQMRMQMNQNLQKQQGKRKLTQLGADTKTYTIRGKEAIVTIAKMKDQDSGQEVRQISAVFRAKDGSPAMLMVIIPETEWRGNGEAYFEKMLRSME